LRLKKRDRVHQVFRWLKDRHPVEGEVRLRIESVMPKSMKDCEGAVWLSEAPLIRINGKQTRSACIYCLLHEYAHVIVYERDTEYPGDDHSDSFYRALGVVERSWLNGGEEDSQKF
jgi:Zn-dependent peptidase ImmA (M78 family)